MFKKIIGIFKRKIFKFAILFFIGSFLYYSNSSMQISIPQLQGSASIYRLPHKDAKKLEAFFRELVIDSAAYTFSGTKPISFLNFNDSWPRCLLPQNSKIIQGWSTWQKYCHLFQNPNLQLWIEQSPWNEDQKILVISNTEAVKQTIQAHEKTFEETLNLPGLQPAELMTKRPFFLKGLQKDEMLMGTLLGFGLENARYFKERTYLNETHNTPIWEKSVIEPIVHKMNRKFWLLQKMGFLEMLPPQFAGFPDSRESKLLKEKYLSDRAKIIQFSQNKTFLEAVLSLYQNGGVILDKE